MLSFSEYIYISYIILYVQVGSLHNNHETMLKYEYSLSCCLLFSPKIKGNWVGGEVSKPIAYLKGPQTPCGFSFLTWGKSRCPFIAYSTYRLHEWAPTPPGHRHPSCSRPACAPGPAPRGTTAGTAVLGQKHGRAPWTDLPEGRRERTGTEGWGGFEAGRSSRRRECWGSSASRRLLGLKPPPEWPGSQRWRADRVRIRHRERDDHQNLLLERISWKESYWQAKEEQEVQDRI